MKPIILPDEDTELRVIPIVKKLHRDGSYDIEGYAVALFQGDNFVKSVFDCDTIQEANEFARQFADVFTTFDYGIMH